MTWEIPIVDRTLNDVLYAKNNQHSSQSLKGALNLSDLNRIEHNTIHLHDKLEEYGYSCEITTHIDWVETDIFYTDEIDRFKQNCINLVDCYTKFNSTPTLVLGIYKISFANINDIEKVLLDIKMLTDYMILGFRKSGTFKSGQGVILP